MTISDQQLKTIRVATKYISMLNPAQVKCIDRINYRLAEWKHRGDFLTYSEKKVLATLEEKLEQQIAWDGRNKNSAERAALARRGADVCRKTLAGQSLAS